eukprot:499126_1
MQHIMVPMSTLFIIMWLCMIMISCISSLNNDDFSLSSGDKQKIVDAHNDARKEVARGDVKSSYGQQPAAKSMPNLKWSNSLAQSAAVQAQWLCDRCAKSKSKCNLDHECQNSDCSRGENLSAQGYEDTTTIGTFVSRVNSWINERRGYGYSKNFVDEQCSIHQCGHYVQVIWADTTKVGCAFRSGCGDLAVGRDKKRSVFVCHYQEPYGWGQYPYDKASGSNNNKDDDDDDVTPGGIGPDCVNIDGLTNSYKNWDGNWKKKGSANGKPQYEKKRSKMRLCYGNSAARRTYGVSRDSGCSGKLYAYCTTNVKDPTACNKWKMMTKSQEYETKRPSASSCSAFTLEEDESGETTTTLTVIIFIVCGAVIALFGCGLFWCCRRRKNMTETKEKVPDEEDGSTDEEEEDVEVECTLTIQTGE